MLTANQKEMTSFDILTMLTDEPIDILSMIDNKPKQQKVVFNALVKGRSKILTGVIEAMKGELIKVKVKNTYYVVEKRNLLRYINQ